MNTQELTMRLDMLIPTQWLSNTFTDGLWDRDAHKEILSKVVELNPKWVERVVNSTTGLHTDGELKLSDVLHDFKGIYSEDEHFLPRISTEVTDDEVYGYTNIQTYRLCLVLDNEPTECSYNPLERFFELVSDEEFEITDINLINWNEVIERYSERLVEGYEYKHQVQLV
tara:strand:- start:1745 stop:2254 length:510 start_codon:yes stop_codon:yes gene_type:complete